MLVLGLDTSSPAVSVALVELQRDGDNVQWGESRVWQQVDARRHGELLATGIAAVLAEFGVDREALGAISVGVGPGPFTGLRVGIVTGLAMADALDIPVYGCCSLDAVAAWDDAERERLVVTDARRKEVYWAEYDADGQRIAGPTVQRPADVVRMLRETQWSGRVLGDGALQYRDEFAGFDVADEPRFPAPDGLVLLAARRILDGAPSEPLTPLYLRRPDAVAATSIKKVTA